MSVIISLAVIAVVLFLAAFLSKRRFGLLGLALTAGATLSTIWQQDAGYVIAALGVIQDDTIANAVALSAVVLLPAVLLLFHGHTYKSIIGRVIGAALFTALALAFLIEPIGYALPLSGMSADIYSVIRANKEILISAGVVIAIIDLFFTKPARHDKEKRH